MGDVAYPRGLHEVGDGLFAYLHPDGGWGWSNAGLVAGDDASLLVDTLFDLALTSGKQCGLVDGERRSSADPYRPGISFPG
jgi:hypothetical protein